MSWEEPHYVGRSKGSKKATSTGHMGGSMGGRFETTKGYKKRRLEKIKAEEEYYASMCGPVIVRKIGDPAP